ncbi:MAG: DDE-type integrase/transposase/recombinase [Ruminococcus sp.]|nr:DDE-type integrase/transposase/recombinase [Ruminococcus sp.]
MFSRKVFAYKISKFNSTHLTKATMLKAIEKRRPSEHLILHTDNDEKYFHTHLKRGLADNNFEHFCLGLYTSCDNAIWDNIFSR